MQVWIVHIEQPINAVDLLTINPEEISSQTVSLVWNDKSGSVFCVRVSSAGITSLQLSSHFILWHARWTEYHFLHSELHHTFSDMSSSDVLLPLRIHPIIKARQGAHRRERRCHCCWQPIRMAFFQTPIRWRIPFSLFRLRQLDKSVSVRREKGCLSLSLSPSNYPYSRKLIIDAEIRVHIAVRQVK